MKKNLLLIFSFFYYQCWSQGNMITINSTVPAQMVICGATKNFAVSIYNPSPFLLTSDTLILSMPSGINYQLGSITGATELNTSILNQPTFLIQIIAVNSGTWTNIQGIVLLLKNYIYLKVS